LETDQTRKPGKGEVQNQGEMQTKNLPNPPSHQKPQNPPLPYQGRGVGGEGSKLTSKGQNSPARFKTHQQRSKLTSKVQNSPARVKTPPRPPPACAFITPSIQHPRALRVLCVAGVAGVGGSGDLPLTPGPSPPRGEGGMGSTPSAFALVSSALAGYAGPLAVPRS